jgi:hypothetical protein
VAWIVIVGVLIILTGEVLWLWQLSRANSQLEQDNGRLRENLQRIKAHTDELRTNEPRIKAIYTRLNDAVVIRKAGDRLPSPGAAIRSQKTTGEPPVIRAFRENGCDVVYSPNELGNLSVTYALGSTGIEFHRLVPLIAQEENSNSFLVVDSLELTRPEGTAPFSQKPTALNAHLVLRLLATNP